MSQTVTPPDTAFFHNGTLKRILDETEIVALGLTQKGKPIPDLDINRGERLDQEEMDQKALWLASNILGASHYMCTTQQYNAGRGVTQPITYAYVFYGPEDLKGHPFIANEIEGTPRECSLCIQNNDGGEYTGKCTVFPDFFRMERTDENMKAIDGKHPGNYCPSWQYGICGED